MFKDKLLEFISARNNNGTNKCMYNEIEVRFHSRGMMNKGVSIDVYDRVIASLSEDPSFVSKRPVNSVSLTGVRSNSKGNAPSPLRMTLYEKTYEAVTKKKVRHTDIDEYNIRIAEAIETNEKISPDEFQRTYKVTSRRERIRTSFVHVSNSWRIDVTKVRSGINYSYEVELEYIEDAKNAAVVGGSIMESLLKIVQDSQYIVTNSFAETLITEYMHVLDISRPTFAGPLPRTLSKKEFADGVISCGYSVTDKADGVRCILVVGRTGHVFMVTRASGIKLVSKLVYVGEVRGVPTCALDCERVGTSLYIFDAMHFDGSDVKCRILSERLRIAGIAQEALSKNAAMNPNLSVKKSASVKVAAVKRPNASVKKSASVKVAAPNRSLGYTFLMKRFTFNNVFHDAKAMWANRNDLPYELDGLIFTPINTRYDEGIIYKWKPYDTIDFFIVKTTAGASGDERWRLHVAGFDRTNTYSHFDFGGMDSKGTFLHKHGGAKRATATQLLIPRKLQDITVPRSAATKFPDRSVIEFKYNKTRQTWIPVKHREDKAFANGVNATNDAWVSITNPITSQNIANGTQVFCGRRFHNAIKDLMIRDFMTGKVVLDIGPGAGGDIKKYAKHSISQLVGVNIVNVEYAHNKRRMRFYKAPNSLYNITEIIRNDPVKEFDVVNCQFAMHYFFRDDELLQSFVKNVKNTLKKGGLLVATCLDGHKVMELLADKTSYENSAFKISLREGTVLNNSLTGGGINVKLHGTKYFKNSSSKEYIIQIPEFIMYMKKQGFRFVKAVSFQSLCNVMMNQCGLMNDDERVYSFLNTGIVFEKQ